MVEAELGDAWAGAANVPGRGVGEKILASAIEPGGFRDRGGREKRLPGELMDLGASFAPCVLMIAMSSPVWQMKPSISRPLQIALATSPSTVAIMREDGFVCPPTEPTSALMTERVSIMSVSPISAARRLRLRRARRCSFADKNVRRSDRFHAPVHPVAGIMPSFALGPCVTTCCAARVRFWTRSQRFGRLPPRPARQCNHAQTHHQKVEDPRT